MSEQPPEAWIVKVFYLGLHNEVTYTILEEDNEYSAAATATGFLNGTGWFHENDRMVAIPTERILRVEKYQK